jgi:magnesium transporter
MNDPMLPDAGGLSALHPADLADRLQRLPVEEARRILHQLSEEKRADVIAELDRAEATELLAAFSSAELADVLEELPHSEAADLAGELPPGQRAAVLAELPPQDSAQVASLLRYPPDSAGGIMSDRFIALRADQTVAECQELLRQRAAEAPAEMTDDIAYLYVSDPDGRLVGVVPFRDLVFRRPHRRMGEIMRRDLKFVRALDDQEKVARLFQQYHYLALPVLEQNDRLVGIVLANQIIDILKAEVTEDMQRMVGLSGEESAWTPWRRALRGRLAWLYVNLATAFMAAAVVALFESTIARWTVLAVFLPIVAGQGGNAGAQTLTVIIRAMALGELTPADGRRALEKELTLALLNGLAVGLVVGVLGYWWKGSALLGVVVGIAMVLNMLAAALSGVLVPYGLKALRIDPALASSIFVTTVTDVAGFFFFLGLAAIGLKLFAP